MRMLFFLLCLLSVKVATAADWYVDGAAAGANNGTSWANAWTNTTAIVAASVSAGDTIYFQGGSHYGTMWHVKSGVTQKIATNATSPAVFDSLEVYDADNLVFDGVLNGTAYFWVTNEPVLCQLSSNLVLRGIRLDRSTVASNDVSQIHGIWIWNSCSKVLIDSCHITVTSGDAINVNQLSTAGLDPFTGIIITNCFIQSVGDDGVQLAGGNAKILHSHFDNQNTAALFGGHPDGIQLNPDSHTLWVEGCFFRGFNQYVFVEYAHSNIYILNNLFLSGATNGTDRGVNMSTRVANWSGDFVVANNTFVDFLAYTAINGGEPATGFTLLNNLFWNCKRGTLGTFTVPEGNIWWDADGVQYYTSDGFETAPPDPRNFGSAVNVNPLLSNPSGTNYSGYVLQAASPAIGAGTNLNTVFTRDFYGTTRGATWDMGAYEYVPPAGLVIENAYIGTLNIGTAP